MNIRRRPGYLYVDPNLTIARTIEISASVHVDVDWAGKVHGIENVAGPVNEKILQDVIAKIRVR